MQFGFCIEINTSLFIAFAKNNAFTFFKIDIADVQINKLAHTYAC